MTNHSDFFNVSIAVFFYAQGITLGVFSPTLPDMTILTSSTSAAMSTTLVWTGVAGMAGALLLGSLFDKYDGMGVLACAIFLQGILLSLAPWCPDLLGFQIMAAATCFFNFGLTAGSQILATLIENMLFFITVLIYDHMIAMRHSNDSVVTLNAPHGFVTNRFRFVVFRFVTNLDL